MHDTVSSGNYVHVMKCSLGPLDKVETVLVTAILDGAVLLERVFFKARMLNGQRMIHDQLGRHHRVDQRRVAALRGDGVT